MTGRVGYLSHRLDTELLAALPLLSLPFRAAVEEAAVAAGSMFWEAMSANGPVTAGHGQRMTDRQTRQSVTDTDKQLLYVDTSLRFCRKVKQ